MADAAAPSLGTHYRRYVTGNVLVLVAGFISFPVLTRLLDNRQYGIFGYFDTWLLLLAAILKLGGQHAIIRFYPHGKDAATQGRFVTSFVLSPFRYSVLLWLVAAIGYGAIAPHLDGEVRAVGWCMVLMLLPITWSSYVNALILAEERSSLTVRLSVIQRWLELVAIVGSVWLVQRSALGAYAGRLAVGIGMALWLAHWIWRTHAPQRAETDRGLWLAGLAYSTPLIINEVFGVLHGLLDRVMLALVLRDFAPVGVFAIGAGLAATLGSVLNGALAMAFTQVSVRQYELAGAAAVVETKRALLGVLIHATVLISVGLACAGGDFLLLLSGPDKAASAPVFAWVAIGYVVYGLLDIMGSGLLLHKRSKTMLGLNLGAAALNLGLNALLIPRLGVHGAVAATLVSYTALALGQVALCPRDLRAAPPLRPTVTALALGLVLATAAQATDLLGMQAPLARLMVMGGLALGLYVAPALLLDPSLRRHALTQWRQWRTAHATSG
jgi:O-antigen/teichoic acid export membrane protein